MSRPFGEKCERCHYFEPLPNFGPISTRKSDEGVCRRYAPQANTNYSDSSKPVAWPVVKRVAWCGEYKQEIAQ